MESDRRQDMVCFPLVPRCTQSHILQERFPRSFSPVGVQGPGLATQTSSEKLPKAHTGPQGTLAKQPWVLVGPSIGVQKHPLSCATRQGFASWHGNNSKGPAIILANTAGLQTNKILMRRNSFCRVIFLQAVVLFRPLGFVSNGLPAYPTQRRAADHSQAKKHVSPTVGQTLIPKGNTFEWDNWLLQPHWQTAALLPTFGPLPRSTPPNFESPPTSQSLEKRPP